MAKDYTSASELIEALRDDVLWLLILVYARRQRMLLPNLRTMGREDFAIEMVLLESATRDIVSRLAALDDDGKGVRSFQTVLRALRREGMSSRLASPIEAQVKGYRQIINPLKIAHRNAYIAHVTETASVVPRIIDDPVDISLATSKAMALLDTLAGGTLIYKFRVGSQEAEIDLRKALSEPPHH
jgi:hypothetical protein